MYRHILIATDGSEPSGKGVETGLDLARASGAKVTVITVSEPYPTFDIASSLGMFADQTAIDSYNAHCRTVAETILTRAEKAAAVAGIDCETLHVENNAPARGILDAAKSRSCDLIVLTSHGRHGLERFILGSQASRVVQGAETSVLVVR
jgi:nucleotide-binding universal stress UspA family protein